MDITKVLPEECIATIISLTSPRDACRLSLVSKAFKSAAASKMVWERFLPQDYQQIISKSVSSTSSSASSLNALPKKDLFFSLSHRPILVEDGNRSFAIDKLSGKKCYMLAARELTIIWGHAKRHWEWDSAANLRILAKSRFSEVARLMAVCWLDIQGRIETKLLSPNTTYGAYFVYRIARRSRNLGHPVKLSLRCGTDLEGDAAIAYLTSRKAPHAHPGPEGQRPRVREDMWMEIEIGEFFNGQADSVVEMRLWEIEDGNWKYGLVLHGIELRPKEE